LLLLAVVFIGSTIRPPPACMGRLFLLHREKKHLEKRNEGAAIAKSDDGQKRVSLPINFLLKNRPRHQKLCRKYKIEREGVVLYLFWLCRCKSSLSAHHIFCGIFSKIGCENIRRSRHFSKNIRKY
jgi:hypothetical protein